MEMFIVPESRDMLPENQQILEILKLANRIIPNLHTTFGYSENALVRYIAFQNGQTSLTSKQEEAVNLIVSEVNGCKPCLSEHTLTAIMHGFSEIEINNVRKGYSSDIKLATMVALAKEIAENKGHISNDTIYDFFDAGHTKDNLVDLILLVGDKSLR
jgi:AhpD family alkylhydroperoxidase